MKRTITALFALSLISATSPTFGHGGGLDSNGCHRETATGTRHCHRAQNDGGFASAASEDDSAADALVILGALSLVGLGFLLFHDRERYTFGPTLVADDDGLGDLGLRFEYRF